MTSTITGWKRGTEVLCVCGESIPASGIIEHGAPICRAHMGPERRTCGLPVYVVVLSRNPLVLAWVMITLEQRRYILDNNLTPLQAMWYLQLPAPLEQSA
jgi:hypothetical protein